MIIRDSNLQILHCPICGDQQAFTRATAADPEKMFILAEEMTAEHKNCLRFQHDPERAIRERQFTKRLQREMRRLEQKGRK